MTESTLCAFLNKTRRSYLVGTERVLAEVAKGINQWVQIPCLGVGVAVSMVVDRTGAVMSKVARIEVGKYAATPHWVLASQRIKFRDHVHLLRLRVHALSSASRMGSKNPCTCRPVYRKCSPSHNQANQRRMKIQRTL